MARILAFLRDERGATAIEYVMIGSIISIVLISGASQIGTTISSNFIGPIATAFN